MRPLIFDSNLAARARRSAGAVLRSAGSRATAFWAALRRTWRRSLQLRVVSLTLLASSLLVGAFAYLVIQKSSEILLSNAEQETRARLEHGAAYAAGQLGVHERPAEDSLQATFQNTIDYLGGGDRRQAGGDVVVLTASDYPEIRTVTSAPVEIGDMISDELRAEVVTGNKSWQVRTGNLGAGRMKYLVYGSPVPTEFGQVELYYLRPLNSQDQAANQIRTTVLATGLALVVLLGVIAALVTRMVVTPVRIAARTAQRLSAGLLDQRMAVNGEDDLARLAASFNQMATNLQRQIVRLEEMSRLQRRFTSDVSHELRTPLTTVRMAADLIFASRDEFEPAVARSAELLQAELDRFESLLTDLLEISRFDAGFAALDAEPTDLVPVVQRVIERFAPLADRQGVPLQAELPDAPVIAEVDTRRVERILRNLIGNAIEHGEGRPVRVTVGADETAVAITVRDYGVGLKPGEEKLVFNRFWRADPSRARQTGGTGLGLSISLEDARLHGGWLEAWGAPGRGAQFRLTLPVRAGARLTSSPLPLVPADAGATEPADAGSARPGAGARAATETAERAEVTG